MKRPAKADVDRAKEVLAGVRRDWLRKPGVTGVDVGFKIQNGRLTERLSVRVHVERKKPPDLLHETEVFNISGQRDRTEGGFPIDVIEARYAIDRPVALDAEDALEAIDRRGFVSPLIGGVSCGNPRSTAGTLGAIVYDRETCDAMILSNWHVLVAEVEAAVGEEIWQPGRVDGGSSARTVAHLTRHRLDRHMDAAVATLDGSRPHERDLLGLGPITGTVAPELGMEVAKSGRTTAITEGVIDGIAATVRIDYGGGAGVKTFDDQIHIVPRPPWPQVDYEVSQGGDSGSVWINQNTNKAVGLHFAGEVDSAPAAENALANPIERVAAELGFSFLPVVCDAPAPPPIPRDRLRDILCRYLPWLCGPGWPPFGGQAAPDQLVPMPLPVRPPVEDLLDALCAELEAGGG